MKIILISALMFLVGSSTFADSRACKATIKALYSKYRIEATLVDEAKSRCELNSIEMQLCLTGEKFFNNDKTSEGMKELFGICDTEIESQLKNIYFN